MTSEIQPFYNYTRQTPDDSETHRELFFTLNNGCSIQIVHLVRFTFFHNFRYFLLQSCHEHMGLTTWKDAPDCKIQKSDVVIAKNYLSEFELRRLNRMVTAYLDFAESVAQTKIPLTMADWEKRLNSFIEMFEYGLLQDAGKVSNEIAKLHAETEFEKYRVIQDRLFMSDFDKYMLELEQHIKRDGGNKK